MDGIWLDQNGEMGIFPRQFLGILVFPGIKILDI
jgi:hypothetical protein